MPQLQPEGRAPGRFPTTQWSRVATAAGRDDGEAREALSMLCRAYWYPIYAFVRHRGFSPEQARDRTQDFFAYILERDLIARADPARGRFRAFLRTVCARHLAGDRDRENAAKRGGGRPRLAIDPLDAERIVVLTRDPESDPYAEIARRLGTTEGNIRVAVHRLRRRYGLLLREEIAATVGDAAQVADEIQALFAALAG
jgi:RNA polymerase sigma-70 factor (ECF subfamily)